MSKVRVTLRTGVLAATMLGLLVTYASFHRQIQRSLGVKLFLNSKSPREESFSELANQAKDPVDFLCGAWATGKVSHRQLVAAFLKENAAKNPSWLARAEPLVLECSIDADTSVRELGLSILEMQRSPRLFEAAQLQLNDLDPSVRMLGLNYARVSDPKKAVPVLMRLLDDPDLRIVTAAEVGLMRLSGEDYGVRARLAIPPEAGQSDQVESTNAWTIRRGVEQRKEWWRVHQKDYELAAGSATPPSDALIADPERPAAPDFTLQDLGGHSVSLSDCKGKVVLLNFWATWCSACLAEIPDLVALQRKMGTQLVILGVALDGVPDEDGDTQRDEDNKSQKMGFSPASVRAKVERAVKLRRIDYPVLLDPKGSVGGQYNGGELPTTVIIDPGGRVRRRFIGERNPAVLEAMVRQAMNPL